MLALTGLGKGELILILVVLLFPVAVVAFGLGVFFLLRMKQKRARGIFATTPSATLPPVSPIHPVPRQCPKCGTLLKSDAPEGLCPACLLQHAFATEGGAPPGTPAFTPPPLAELAKLFPQLEILEVIGQGGMGAVYKARQPALDRFVALKILAPRSGGDLDFAGRFSREARALAKLSHPNIVAVYDYGQVQRSRRREEADTVKEKATPPPDVGGYEPTDLNYFIMEFVDGPNLRQVERAGKLSPREALEIIPQICAALQFAHDEGIVHRDIKPENVLLDKKGRVKIADFGLAKILGQDADFRLTGARDVMGTPHYMAPEQVEKPQEVDHRADIYSLGVVFYEMLTGELPIGKFDPPSHKVQIDVRLDDVVLRSLANNPDRRYQHVSEVKTELESIAESPNAQGAAPRINPIYQGVDYRSDATLFGLPLIHVTSGVDPETGKVRVSKGIIAIGGRAQGVVAIGGFATGVIAFGGGAIGLLAFGGLAIGLFSFGGLAIALAFALGGGAIAPIALGGGAVGYMVLCGGGFGVHVLAANIHDPVAQHFFGTWGRTWILSFPIISTFVATLAVGFGLIATLWARWHEKSPNSNRIIDAIRAWLAVMDRGDYARSWELAAPYFQAVMKRQDWVGKGESIRRPLGSVHSRQLSQARFLAGGNQFQAKFETAFEGTAATVETVTFARQPNSDWKAIGYLIKPALPKTFYGCLWVLAAVLFAGLIMFGASIAWRWPWHTTNPNRGTFMPAPFSSNARADFHYQVFECDAALIDQVIPLNQRRPVVAPPMQSSPNSVTTETRRGGFKVINRGTIMTDASFATIDSGVLDAIIKSVTPLPGILVDAHREVFSPWWNPGMANTWSYSRQGYTNQSLAEGPWICDSSGGGGLGVRLNDGRLEIRLDLSVDHEPFEVYENAPGPVRRLSSRLFYEGPAPEGSLVFVIPFVRADNSAHYLVVTYQITNLSRSERNPSSVISGTSNLETSASEWTNGTKAFVRIRGFTANSATSPTVDYAAIGPKGYALQPTASSGGRAYVLPSTPNSGQYNAVWSFPVMRREQDVKPGERQPPNRPPLDFYEEHAFECGVIKSELKALQDQGVIAIEPDQPQLLFSVTNLSGDVLQGFLQLMKVTSSAAPGDLPLLPSTWGPDTNALPLEDENLFPIHSSSIHYDFYDRKQAQNTNSMTAEQRKAIAEIARVRATKQDDPAAKIRPPTELSAAQTQSATNFPIVANSNPPKAIVLQRATNQLIDASNDVRTVTVWSDSYLEPGETISHLVKRGDNDVKKVGTGLTFLEWSPDGALLRSVFNWYFGGTMEAGFGDAEANAAVAQLSDTGGPVLLTPGKPRPVFSVTNNTGEILTGYLELDRTLPDAASGTDPVAVVSIRSFRGYSSSSPGIDYSAKLPPGYALRATATTGTVDTVRSAGPYEYQSDWRNMPSYLRPQKKQAGILQPPKIISMQEMQAQAKVLSAQLQALQDEVSFTVALGKPKTIFSVTNGEGEIFQGFLELVGPQKTPSLDNAVPTLAEQPPVVVGTYPTSGARDVPPGETEIRVRFSKAMQDGSWSWSTAWENSTPETVDSPRYLNDGRTCVMKVRLEPGRTYAWWLNSNKFHNFKDRSTRPAVPYLLIFQTKPN